MGTNDPFQIWKKSPQAINTFTPEVQCDIDQLYDLTDRPDVERYAWDGSDVDYNVTIWWESSPTGIELRGSSFDIVQAPLPRPRLPIWLGQRDIHNNIDHQVFG